MYCARANVDDDFDLRRCRLDSRFDTLSLGVCVQARVTCFHFRGALVLMDVRRVAMSGS